MTDVVAITEKVNQSSQWVGLLRSEMAKVIIGQNYLIDRLLVGLLANGHLLLEGVPGLAKTLSVHTLSKIIKADFKRIQFTPDLLPTDIVGTLIFNPQKGEFYTKQGPIFSNIVLADEVNRAPAKVQSALLECMQERQVTIGETTYSLPTPFLVLATENPVDQEGTYRLPEAQMDRFMLKMKIGYPGKDEERLILESMSQTSVKHQVNALVSTEQILEARNALDQIYTDCSVKDYIISLIFSTREPKTYKLDLASLISFGASPRATIALSLAAKASAFLQGRGYVTPQDVKAMAPDVLRHRIILSYEAEAEGLTTDDIIQTILSTIPVP